jgi:hypothetical protein
MRAVINFIRRIFGQHSSPVVPQHDFIAPQDDFRTGLQAWVDLAPEEEAESRAKAMEEIINAKNQRSTSLSLRQLRLSSLPEEIWSLTSLKILDLGYNNIETLPAGFSNLAALEILNLNDNYQLKEISAETLTLPALIVLSLRRNHQLIASPNLLDRLSELETRGCDIRYPDHFSIVVKLRLDQIATKYRKENAIEAANPIPNITVLLHRFLDEDAERGIEIGELLKATTPILNILEENPNHLKWAEEIANHYLEGCVNQPVAGWSEISALASIAAAPTMLEKLESAKHLLVNDRVKEFVGKNFARSAVEVEAGNALLREMHKKLLSERVITKPWLAVPGRIANEGTIVNWLTPERVQEFRFQIEPLLQKKPEELAELLLDSVHCKTWGEINFPEQLKAINDPYEKDRAKRLEEFEDITQGQDREALTQKFTEIQKTLADKNYATVSEKIVTLTRETLAREMQARGSSGVVAASATAITTDKAIINRRISI